MIPGVDVYSMSWMAPGRSFTALQNIQLNFTGCDFDTYWLDEENSRTLICTVTCPSEGITDTIAREQCNGTGCCGRRFPDGARLKFQLIRHNRKIKGQAKARGETNASSLWDRISVDTDEHLSLRWGVILDQPMSCAAAANNKTTYACVSEHITCMDQDEDGVIHPSYRCGCDDGYVGNPYVPGDGCLPDRGNGSKHCNV